MARKLKAEQVRKVCDPNSLGFESTEKLEPVQTIIGQSRALQAIQFGLGIPNFGFNIYAAGLPGTGKRTAIVAFLERIARDKEVPPDWCYVHNFQDAYRPRALRLKAGTGVQFQKDMKKFIESAQSEVRKAFESEDYGKRRDATAHAFNEKREKLFNQLNQMAHDKGFAIQMSPMGLLLIPIVNGKPLSEQEMLALVPQQKEELAKKREQIQDQIKEAMAQMRNWDREGGEQIEKMDEEVVKFVLDAPIEELAKKYGENPDVSGYLKDIEKDIIENMNLFRSPSEPDPANPFARMAAIQTLRKYEVNVLVDNSHLKGAPVIIETNPTFNNLVGRLEKEAYFGAVSADFTMIRPGSLHKANGGYIVLRIDDVLRNLLSWDIIKRSLREKKIIIEDLAERFGFLSMKSILPEPVPLNIKVIIIGENMYYHTLYSLDREFAELFKVKADFDSRMDLNKENLKQYNSTLCAVCGKESLRHLDKKAVAKIIEHSSRLAEDQRKLSTRFAEIADIIREANYWASSDGAKLISGEHVSKAIEQKVYRSNLIYERIREMIERDVLKIDTRGKVVGQVNGLSVIAFGDLYFGRPNRITASIASGREGVVDIEREAKLGGPIHTKGVLILSGVMAERYAATAPLSLSARLVFEQSYEEVEGDSASTTELYALLSALANVPIKQGIAATGSINQKGEVQAIGGVNQKIEGFYDVCKAKGLTGDQGVIIPGSNVQNLMLREDVVEAIKKGKFTVYSVKNVDEGIEILTGIKAGKRLKSGKFPRGSINGMVQDRLEQLAKGLKEFEKKPEEKKKPGNKNNNSS
ncbi:MAG: ATP-dependent protease [Chloroflexi bacterium]|nr:ATP-dependent protease [Chloroflexota bacterium]